MKLGQVVWIGGERCHISSFRPDGRPMFANSKGEIVERRKKQTRAELFDVGESVRLVGLRDDEELPGEIICTSPLTAAVLGNDPVWAGCREINGNHIRKARA